MGPLAIVPLTPALAVMLCLFIGGGGEGEAAEADGAGGGGEKLGNDGKLLPTTLLLALTDPIPLFVAWTLPDTVFCLFCPMLSESSLDELILFEDLELLPDLNGNPGLLRKLLLKLLLKGPGAGAGAGAGGGGGGGGGGDGGGGGGGGAKAEKEAEGKLFAPTLLLA